MKKLAYVAGLGLALCLLYSCEDEPKNPGRFDVQSELQLDTLLEASRFEEVSYRLKEHARRDTNYVYLIEVQDTVFEYDPVTGDSTYVYGKDGKVLVDVYDVEVFSKKVATLIEYEPIYLHCYRDTLTFNLLTNARWMAPTPVDCNWLETQIVQGGGDGHITIVTNLNRYDMVGPEYQYIYTSDSMMCAKIPFYKYGWDDEPDYDKFEQMGAW